ncbi:hypothetical protein GQ53DRAFT_48816 [Thozetella sp. PMI_491]|nr:hypothetical protein GQ53DRAFT_48816 [Thozetella sp. PMI_491]
MSEVFSPVFASPWSRAPREIACHRCRHRKKKCDKRRPTCSECVKSGSECVVLRPKKANARNVPANYVHLLEDHVASLESRLRQRHPSIADDHLAITVVQTPRSPTDSTQRMPAPEDVEDLDQNGPDPGKQHASIEADAGDDAMDVPRSELEWSIGTTEESLLSFDFGTIEFATDVPVPVSIEQATSLDPRLVNMESNIQAILGRPDISSSYLSDRHLSITLGDRYASEYFSNAHPMWPFLHRKQWHEWWATWQQPQSTSQRPEWVAFFVDMVLSIGALLVQNSDPATEHIENSKSLHSRSLAKYNSYAIQGRSPVIRTQSSLILTVHAMHLDSVGTLFDRASEVMMNCALSRVQNGNPFRNNREQLDDTETEIRRQTIRSCYVIDILLSYSTDHGVTFADTFTQDELPDSDDSLTESSFDLSSHGSPEGSQMFREDALDEHVLRLRRIQYRILKLVQRLEYEAEQEQHPVPNLWRSQIRHDLTRWVKDVSIFPGHHEIHDRFKSTSWLLKLANYSIISLFPNPRLAVRGGDSRHLVAAATQVLITFRRLRVKEHTSCYTWTALVHQFQAGIIMMYSLWATPTHQQHSLYDRREICRAMFSCSATLVDFANKWRNACAFRDVFDLLTQGIPISEYGDPVQEWSLAPDQSEELCRLSAALEELKVTRRVVGLLLEIARGPRPGYSALSIQETQWVQFETPG